MSVERVGNAVDGAARAAGRATSGAVLVLLGLHLALNGVLLTSADGVGTSAGIPELRLDPNTATAEQLELLPRIGPKLAQRIIAYRAEATSKPAFGSADDLQQVRGIGPKTVERLRPMLRMDGDARRPG